MSGTWSGHLITYRSLILFIGDEHRLVGRTWAGPFEVELLAVALDQHLERRALNLQATNQRRTCTNGEREREE